MNTVFLLLIIMVFLHIFDDFILQTMSSVSKLKTKKYWVSLVGEDLSNTKYRYDYIVGVVIHSIFWSIMIHIPLLIMFSSYGLILLSIILNAIVHGIVDHEKANKYLINLITDQSIHFLQIITTILVWVFLLN